MMGMQLPTKSMIINDISGRGLRYYESGNDKRLDLFLTFS